MKIISFLAKYTHMQKWPMVNKDNIKIKPSINALGDGTVTARKLHVIHHVNHVRSAYRPPGRLADFLMSAQLGNIDTARMF